MEMFQINVLYQPLLDHIYKDLKILLEWRPRSSGDIFLYSNLLLILYNSPEVQWSSPFVQCKSNMIV